MYSLVKRQLKYTQAGAYTTYEKKFKEMVVDLHATIYGARAWPDYDVVIQKDYNSGKVSAFAAVIDDAVIDGPDLPVTRM